MSKSTVTIAAIVAFLLCLLGGISAIYSTLADKDDYFYIGIGLYFIGKAFFVGPSLLLTRNLSD